VESEYQFGIHCRLKIVDEGEGTVRSDSLIERLESRGCNEIKAA
jgi:hypothetical protein